MAKKRSNNDGWGFSEPQPLSDWGDIDLGLDLEGTGGKKKRRGDRLSIGRTVGVCFVALIGSLVIGMLGYVTYTNYIVYPEVEVVDYSTTGAYCLEQWELQLKVMEVPFETSYINAEIVYSNGDESKVRFYKKMLSTIEYIPSTVKAKNVFGNDFIDRGTGEVVLVDSFVSEGEEVGMKVVDYDSIDFEKYKTSIDSIMAEYELKFGDVDYENKLVDVFLTLMDRIPVSELPTKIVYRVPNMVYLDGVYTVTEEEDIYLDKLLFSSNDFYECLDRFSVCAKGSDIPIREEYSDWSALSDEVRSYIARPDKYDYKSCCAKKWCGAYYLKNEHKVVGSDGNEYVSSIRAEVGDGTIGNPLGLNTDAVTSVFISEYDELGNIVSYEEYPIRVELVEYGYSKDAIDYFELKDVRNRGITLASDVQYCYMVFNVTNLSDIELTIDENMGLCDVNGNMQARTGTIYGLQGSVTLKPDETGKIETWQSSTILWKKYVVWGNDFNRRADLVYFRLLAGDVENEDEFKGVTVNTTKEKYLD